MGEVRARVVVTLTDWRARAPPFPELAAYARPFSLFTSRADWEFCSNRVVGTIQG